MAAAAAWRKHQYQQHGKHINEKASWHSAEA